MVCIYKNDYNQCNFPKDYAFFNITLTLQCFMKVTMLFSIRRLISIVSNSYSFSRRIIGPV